MRSISVTTQFLKNSRKMLSYSDHKSLEKIWDDLHTGHARGKPLRSKWLWEARISGKRVYFAISETAALFIDVSGKKNQQVKIDQIHADAEHWLKELNTLSAP